MGATDASSASALRIVPHAVATAEEIELATLGARLRVQRRAFWATFVGELAFGAWARKPG